MAIGDMVLKTWQNGVDVVNATNFQRFEAKLFELDKQHQIKIKNSDENVNNSTAYQSDDDLFISLETGVIYAVELFLRQISGSDVPKIKLKWDFTGTFLSAFRWSLGVDYNDADPTHAQVTMVEIETTADHICGSDSLYYGYIRENMLLQASVAGVLTLNWAQYVATAVNTTVASGSHIKIVKYGAI